MGTERAVTVSGRKRLTREHVAGNFEKHCKTNRVSRCVERGEQERRIRVWGGHTVLNLLRAAEDAGWIVAIVVIVFTTFAVSSIFVKGARLQSMCGSFSRSLISDVII
jgi:hypothetical protein